MIRLLIIGATPGGLYLYFVAPMENGLFGSYMAIIATVVTVLYPLA